MWTAPSSACRPAAPRSSRSQPISRTAYATARSAIPRGTWSASISFPSPALESARRVENRRRGGFAGMRLASYGQALVRWRPRGADDRHEGGPCAGLATRVELWLVVELRLSAPLRPADRARPAVD